MLCSEGEVRLDGLLIGFLAVEARSDNEAVDEHGDNCQNTTGETASNASEDATHGEGNHSGNAPNNKEGDNSREQAKGANQGEDAEEQERCKREHRNGEQSDHTGNTEEEASDDQNETRQQAETNEDNAEDNSRGHPSRSTDRRGEEGNTALCKDTRSTEDNEDDADRHPQRKGEEHEACHDSANSGNNASHYNGQASDQSNQTSRNRHDVERSEQERSFNEKRGSSASECCDGSASESTSPRTRNSQCRDSEQRYNVGDNLKNHIQGAVTLGVLRVCRGILGLHQSGKALRGEVLVDRMSRPSRLMESDRKVRTSLAGIAGACGASLMALSRASTT